MKTYIKTYDTQGRMAGMKEFGGAAPDIRYAPSLDDPSWILSTHKLPFTFVNGIWVGYEPDSIGFWQFPNISCNVGDEMTPPFTLNGNIELDDYSCSGGGFPTASVIRSDANVGGEIVGKGWKIILPVK